jgi:hypothetical protein
MGSSLQAQDLPPLTCRLRPKEAPPKLPPAPNFFPRQQPREKFTPDVSLLAPLPPRGVCRAGTPCGPLTASGAEACRPSW